MLLDDPEGVAEISIHTPARGVTRQSHGKSMLQTISIHTPARGVTFVQETL